MKRLLILLHVFMFTQAFARVTETWCEGSLVLANKSVLTGSISYNPAHDLILFRRNDSVTVYLAHKIHSFYYYDQQANINRKYITIEENGVAFHTYHVYEVVLTGNVTVIRKQKSGLLIKSATSDKDDYEYYVRMDNELVSLLHFRKKIYSHILTMLPDQVLAYVRDHKLNPDEPAHAIRIIKYYNQQLKASSYATL